MLSNIEQRVLLGVVFFFGTLLLAGWVLINEEARMQTFTEQYESRSIERGAALFVSSCATCHGVNGQGIASRAPALNNPRLFNGDRLEEMSWTGALEDYVQNAIAAGRPNSGSYWNNNVMPTWSQAYGGPMRPDQVRDTVRYVLNWETSALDEENPPQINQDFLLPGQNAAAAEDVPAVGNDEILQIVAELDARDPVGDPGNGETLYAQYGCLGCHLNGGAAPDTIGTMTRITEQRLPALEGYTANQYIVESIWLPNAYVVEGYTEGVMPQNFSEQISIDELADLVAYLETQTQPLE